MSTERKDAQKSGTRVRVPMGARRSKLQLSEEETQAFIDAGWVTRWVNDADGRIQAALAGGYKFVKPEEARSAGAMEIHQGNTDIGAKVSKVVSRGEPIIRAYLMKIEKEFWVADQQAKEEINLRVDEALQGDGSGEGIEAVYKPK
jgi:hypothetical protein